MHFARPQHRLVLFKFLLYCELTQGRPQALGRLAGKPPERVGVGRWLWVFLLSMGDRIRVPTCGGWQLSPLAICQETCMNEE